MEQYGKAVSLRNLLGQQQLQQQQIRMNELQFKEKARKDQAGQIIRQSYANHAGDWDAVMKEVSQNPKVDPETLFALQTHIDTDKAKRTSDSIQGNLLHAGQLEHLREEFDKVYDMPADAPPEQLEMAYQKSRGLVLKDPQIASQFYGITDPKQLPENFPGKERGNLIRIALLSESEAHKKEAERKQNILFKEREVSEKEWKEVGGQLVNVRTGETKGTAIDTDQVNQANEARWQVLNPRSPLPSFYKAKPGASKTDVDRIDKLLEATEKALGTKGQQDVINEMRRQTLAIQEQTAGLREQKAGEQWVSWTDPQSGRAIAGPLSMANNSGAKDIAAVPTEQVRNIQDARGVVQLIGKRGDPSRPETMGINQLIDSLDKDGKLGVVSSRINSFLTGGVGATPGDDARIPALLNKVNLAMTLSMKAHFGASGGRSPQMLEHFLAMANAKKMNAATLKAGLNAIGDYFEDRGMTPGASGAQPAGGAAPAGATHKVRGPDGKMHYTNAAGTVDLGVAPE